MVDLSSRFDVEVESSEVALQCKTRYAPCSGTLVEQEFCRNLNFG